MNAKEWKTLAQRQTFKSLNAFIKKVQKEFPGYEGNLTKEEMQNRYSNGIYAGILISLASFHATSNTYGYSCNQAGCVRNSFYKAVFDDLIEYEEI